MNVSCFFWNSQCVLDYISRSVVLSSDASAGSHSCRSYILCLIFSLIRASSDSDYAARLWSAAESKERLYKKIKDTFWLLRAVWPCSWVLHHKHSSAFYWSGGRNYFQSELRLNVSLNILALSLSPDTFPKNNQEARQFSIRWSVNAPRTLHRWKNKHKQEKVHKQMWVLEIFEASLGFRAALDTDIISGLDVFSTETHISRWLNCDHKQKHLHFLYFQVIKTRCALKAYI